MQKDGVEHDTRGGIKTERYVRNTKDCEAARQLPFDSTDSLNRLGRVTPVFFDTRGNRKGQRIKENVGCRQTQFLRCLLVRPFGNSKFSLSSPRHALFINRSDYQTRTIALRQLNYFRESRLAVFVIGRIENALAAGVLESGLHLLPFR